MFDMQIYLLLPSVSAKAILKMLSHFLNDVQVCMGGNFGNQNLARTAILLLRQRSHTDSLVYCCAVIPRRVPCVAESWGFSGWTGKDLLLFFLMVNCLFNISRIQLSKIYLDVLTSLFPPRLSSFLQYFYWIIVDGQYYMLQVHLYGH